MDHARSNEVGDSTRSPGRITSPLLPALSASTTPTSSSLMPPQPRITPMVYTKFHGDTPPSIQVRVRNKTAEANGLATSLRRSASVVSTLDADGSFVWVDCVFLKGAHRILLQGPDGSKLKSIALANLLDVPLVDPFELHEPFAFRIEFRSDSNHPGMDDQAAKRVLTFRVPTMDALRCAVEPLEDLITEAKFHAFVHRRDEVRRQSMSQSMLSWSGASMSPTYTQ